MPSIGKILRVIGQSAAIASQLTPAGAAVTKGLEIGAKVLNQPNQAADTPDSIHGIAVQAVLDNLPTVIQAAVAENARGDGRTLAAHLRDATVEIELWLSSEAARYSQPSK